MQGLIEMTERVLVANGVQASEAEQEPYVFCDYCDPSEPCLDCENRNRATASHRGEVYENPSTVSAIEVDGADLDDAAAIESAKLPDGKTCADCFHLHRCTWLISVDPTNTDCDWTPSRFRQRK